MTASRNQNEGRAYSATDILVNKVRGGRLPTNNAAERMLTASARLRLQGREMLDTLARAIAGHEVSQLRSEDAPVGA